MNDQPQHEPHRLIVYGHDYCAQALLLAEALDEHGIAYEWRDILRGDPAWKDRLRSIARGYLSVPTVIFHDGSYLVEPWPSAVLARLGLQGEGSSSG